MNIDRPFGELIELNKLDIATGWCNQETDARTVFVEYTIKMVNVMRPDIKCLLNK